MSTIEICSIIIGKVRVTTKQGEVTAINFEDKGGIGYAVVSEEQAEQLLKIKDEYWKPGQRNNVDTDAVETALANDPVAAAAAAELTTGVSTAGKNVAQMAELIKLCETVEEVEQLVGDDQRVGVITAASNRKAQLAKQ